MARKEITKFSGGIASNSKSGLQNSFRFAKHLNIYTDDDSITLNPIPIKVSGSIVTDLVKWMVDVNPYATDKYATDASGNIYKITSSEVWTQDRTGATIGNGAAGQGLCGFANALYYSTSTTIGRNYPLNGTPAYNDDFLSDGVNNLDLSVTASGQTYAIPTSISEASTGLRTIIPTTDPLKTVAVYVTAKGTGNWTVTVHDSNNNSIGTSTIANASLTNGAMNSFNLSTPARINIGLSYHFHVTSSVNDGTLQTSVSNDLSTAQYNTYFGILIGDASYHDIKQHTNGANGTIVIANANYFAEYTMAGAYSPNKIAILPGYNIRYFVRENEFLVGMAWKGTAIDGFEDGMAFYWDGISPYYNYSKPITGGLPNASVNYKNRIMSVLGSSGVITMGTEPFRTIQPMPLLANGKKIEVLPGAMTTWQNRAHIGFGANTDDSSIYQGVYEFGNQSDRAISYTSVSTEVLNFGYTISTGDEQSTTMQIGCVAPFGKDMYIGWKSASSTFGVDKVSKTNNPASTGSYESLIDDDIIDQQGNIISAPQKLKEALRITVYYDVLPTGCTITPKYRINRTASWTTGTGTDIGIAGSNYCIMDISQRYFEIEYGFDIVATTGYPLISGFLFELDPLLGERDTP